MSISRDIALILDRIEYIDVARAIGIILVVLGHVVSVDTPIKVVLYSFHMPLFFLISGMLIELKGPYSINTWKVMLLKKANGLLIPYIVWGLIYCPFSFKRLALILYGTRETLISAESLSSLWFLPVLFVAFFLVQVVLYITSKASNHKFSCIVFGLFFFLVSGFVIPHSPGYGDPWGIDVAFIAASFMITGMLIRKMLDRISGSLLYVVVLAICTVVFAFFVRFSNSEVGYVLMSNAIYGDVYIFLINAFTGSLIVLLLSWLISRHIKNLYLLQILGQNTMGIFVVHKPIVELCRGMISHFGMNYNLPLLSILVTFVVIAVSLVIVLIIEHILPEILGKKRIQHE